MTLSPTTMLRRARRGVKSYRIDAPTAAVLLMAIAHGAPARAAAVAWGSPTDQTGNLSDFVTTGTLVSAVSPNATVTVDGITFYGPVTSNPATFTNSQITVSGPGSSPYTTSPHTYPPGTFDANYALLVDRAAYTPATNGATSLNFNGLTIGTEYTVQIFAPWWDGDWVTYFNDGTANSPGIAPGSFSNTTAQYIVGTFTADSTTETLTIHTNTPAAVLDAVQLRTTADATAAPEPATLAILAPALLALARLRRRQAASV